jgi:short subunit dehydrogenase-like uncharacterized protein
VDYWERALTSGTMVMSARFLIYGANGYTGRLLVEEALRRGQRPLLAGRNREEIGALALATGLEGRSFSLQDHHALDEALGQVDALLLAAGPFEDTSRLAVDACLRTETHYLDITGELAVFEAIFERDAEAKARGITLLPGVGFDVVPSDCLARALFEALPSAHTLELAFASDGGMSPGTLRTTLRALPGGGRVRREGQIRECALGEHVREIPFRDESRVGVSIPWGDVASAYRSTKIPNITVYLGDDGRLRRAIKTLERWRGTRLFARLVPRLEALAARAAPGPSLEARTHGRSQLWGAATDAEGRTAEGTLTTPEGYTLTARAGIESTLRLAAGKAKPGALTPSLAFGARFIEQFDDCDLRVPPPAAEAPHT